MRKRLAVLGTMAVLSPLGILLPTWFKAGSAWGEWSNEELVALFGSVPAGLKHLSASWQAPIPDYSLPGSNSLIHQSLATVFSAFLGTALILILGWGLGLLLVKRKPQ